MPCTPRPTASFSVSSGRSSAYINRAGVVSSMREANRLRSVRRSRNASVFSAARLDSCPCFAQPHTRLVRVQLWRARREVLLDDLGVPGQVRLDRLKAPVDLVAVPEDGQRVSPAPPAAPAGTQRRLRHARWRRPAAAGSAGSAGGPWGLAVMLLMAEMQSWRSQASSTGVWPRLAPVRRTPGVSRKQLVQQHEVGVAIPARAHDVREVLAQPARYRVLVALLGPAARLLAGPDSGTS